MRTITNKLLRMAAGTMVVFTIMSGSSMANNGTLTLVVGASPGGTTDLVARGLSRDLADLLKQTVIVENRPGAGGNIAADYVARSKKDGNTLLVSFTSFSVNASLYNRLSFDPLNDFTPISLLAEVPSVLIANSSFPASSIAQTIKILKDNPGTYSFGIGGIGSSLHMATASFQLQSGIQELMVPYKGTAPAIQDLLAGQVDLMFASTENVINLKDSERVKILGLTSDEAMAEFSGVEPINKTLDGFTSKAWFGIFSPAGVSPERINQLSSAVRKAANQKAFQQLFAKNGGRVVTLSPDEFKSYIEQDIKDYAEIVKFTGVTLD